MGQNYFNSLPMRLKLEELGKRPGEMSPSAVFSCLSQLGRTRGPFRYDID